MLCKTKHTSKAKSIEKPDSENLLLSTPFTSPDFRINSRLSFKVCVCDRVSFYNNKHTKTNVKPKPLKTNLNNCPQITLLLLKHTTVTLSVLKHK